MVDIAIIISHKFVY